MQLQAEGSFNSMKVRLKRAQDLTRPVLYRFQFHEGPIKTIIIRKLQIIVRRVSIP